MLHKRVSQLVRGLLLGAASVAVFAFSAGKPPEILYQIHLIDPGPAETAAIADVNRDGKPDIISGEFWYESPAWVKHKFREIQFTNNYIDDFSDLPLDVNGDGRIDVVSCSWFSHKLWWNENPGSGTAMWKEHLITDQSPVEFAYLVDLDNDGKKQEVLPQFGNAKAPLTWYERKDGGFVAHPVSDRSYGHGIGAGDVNGDGRTDIITQAGWLEAPPDPRSDAWTLHAEFKLGDTSFIHVLDINGDGRNDLVSSMAHNYGIFWVEQNADHTWTKHDIDTSWSQGHSFVMTDLNRDGQPDFLTGKRFMAHNGNDPGEREPLGVYWYEFRKGEKGVEWIKHLIDYGSRAGAGMQITPFDFTRKQYPDLVAGGKSGLFFFKSMPDTAGTQPQRRSQSPPKPAPGASR